MKTVLFLHRDNRSLIINEDGTRKHGETIEVKFDATKGDSGKLEVLFNEDEGQLIKLEIAMPHSLYEKIQGTEAAVLEFDNELLSLSIWPRQEGNVIIMKRVDIIRVNNSLLDEFFVTM